MFEKYVLNFAVGDTNFVDWQKMDWLCVCSEQHNLLLYFIAWRQTPKSYICVVIAVF